MKKETVERRPAGTTAAIASMLVLVVSWAGVDLTPEAAAVLIGGVTAIVSLLNPR